MPSVLRRERLERGGSLIEMTKEVVTRLQGSWPLSTHLEHLGGGRLTAEQTDLQDANAWEG